jgi:glycosyltransferase involved in cell wall biosynthesis
LTNSFFSRAYTIATQGEIAAALQKTFAIPQEKLLIEPNGVDLEAFGRATSKQEARQALGLPQDAKIVLYAGRFYGWKSLSILAQAARLLPSIRWQTVGGNEEEYISATGVSDIPPNLHFAGLRSVDTVPVWIAAADVALVLGTKENENSYRFTAPMKVFEYMAVRRPVIASATPALKSFVPQDDVMWYEPDDASSLENAVSRVLEEYSHERLERAFIDSQKHTWDARAERIYVWIRNMLNFAHDR